MGSAVRNNDFYDKPKGGTTLAEFMELINRSENQDKVIELIDGSIVMMAGNASGNHHRIAGYISRKIGNYLEGKTCEVFQGMNAYFYSDKIENCKNVFQPDVMVCCEKEKVTDRGYEGVPEFIVEVISKTTARFDYFIKCRQYMYFGVKEYWIVDLFRNQILVYINCGDDQPEIQRYDFNDKIKVTVFDDLYIDFSEILRIVDTTPVSKG